MFDSSDIMPRRLEGEDAIDLFARFAEHSPKPGKPVPGPTDRDETAIRPRGTRGTSPPRRFTTRAAACGAFAACLCALVVAALAGPGTSGDTRTDDPRPGVAPPPPAVPAPASLLPPKRRPAAPPGRRIRRTRARARRTGTARHLPRPTTPPRRVGVPRLAPPAPTPLRRAPHTAPAPRLRPQVPTGWPPEFL